jgi:hypothetical protein
MDRIVYTVRKSFGWIEGRDHKHVVRGTELTSGTDDALISLLHRKGAHIEQTDVLPGPPPEQVEEKTKGKKK